MNNKKAIEILQKQKLKLEDSRTCKDENWVFQTASYIKVLFGENSAEYAFISKFQFRVYFTNYDSETNAIRELNGKTLKAKNYLENCIETISNKGVYKHPKQNLMHRISETAFWTIISISVPGLLTIGGLFGNMYSDTQNIELKTENKTLKDSLSILKNHATSVAQKKSNPITNTNNNGK